MIAQNCLRLSNKELSWKHLLWWQVVKQSPSSSLMQANTAAVPLDLHMSIDLAAKGTRVQMNPDMYCLHRQQKQDQPGIGFPSPSPHT